MIICVIVKDKDKLEFNIINASQPKSYVIVGGATIEKLLL